MASQQPDSIRVVRRPRDEPWDAYWAENARERLQRAGIVVAEALHVGPEDVGLLPAVYFPRLRMGAVTFRWPEDADVAFPWQPPHIPPPFTCFAPPIAETEEPDVNLIARVGSIVDRAFDSTPDKPPLIAAPGRTAIGTATWIPGRNPLAAVVDADDLIAADVEEASAAFILPPVGAHPPAYIPLLYAHARKKYRDEQFDEVIRRAVAGEAVLADALRVAAEAARICATRWLNPKTLLLNQAGFDFLKDDLQRRVGAGELYAEIFFDIDDFKAKNDRFGYDGADLIAARLVDRVLLAVQREVADEHADYRAQRDVPYGAPNSFRALLAHVSGDEFKLFVRSNARRELMDGRSPEDTHAAQLRAFAERLVAATTTEIQSPTTPRALRHARLFGRYTPTALFTGGAVVADDKTSISAGVAIVGTKGKWPISDDDYRLSRYPVDPGVTAAARQALDELDPLAERALMGAKRVPTKVLLSDELVARGGRLQVTQTDAPRLLLGSIDGIRAGDEFLVYPTPDRTGEPLATIRVRMLDETHRRWAPVERVAGPDVEPRREDYYLRYRGPAAPRSAAGELRWPDDAVPDPV